MMMIYIYTHKIRNGAAGYNMASCWLDAPNFDSGSF
jgi:hypothetical protein